MKIRPVGAEVFHAEDRRTDGHDEANSQSSPNLWTARPPTVCDDPRCCIIQF